MKEENQTHQYYLLDLEMKESEKELEI